MNTTRMNEDWIKKVQKICRRCHNLTVSRIMLQRYVIGLHQKLQESKKQEGRISGPKSVASWEVLEALVA